ncbi:hypothetical protein TIFTF001_002562 [Ficus carica]|uniref:Uncharacterized protein n=1 Tax=Ficus carica TaxID=3494 RepID=A0AA88CTY5_FICCA|nr:hypothetical protein TIFTF001_002562 [Ficus carica]
MEDQSPDRKDQKKNNADSVRNSMALCEGVSKSAGCPDVLLKKVAANKETYHDTDQIVPQCVCKEAWSHNQKKN